MIFRYNAPMNFNQIPEFPKNFSPFLRNLILFNIKLEHIDHPSWSELKPLLNFFNVKDYIETYKNLFVNESKVFFFF